MSWSIAPHPFLGSDLPSAPSRMNSESSQGSLCQCSYCCSFQLWMPFPLQAQPCIPHLNFCLIFRLFLAQNTDNCLGDTKKIKQGSREFISMWNFWIGDDLKRSSVLVVHDELCLCSEVNPCSLLLSLRSAEKVLLWIPGIELSGTGSRVFSAVICPLIDCQGWSLAAFKT